MMWLIISFFALLFVLIYIKMSNNYKYWIRKHVKFVKPLPFLGNMSWIIFRTKSMANFLEELYNSYPNERYVGFYRFSDPVLLIRDPELIKQITIKDFDSFPDHHVMVSEDVDPLWKKNLISMKGEKWHEMRSTLSPSFTSSKMKMMFVLMKACTKQLCDNLQQQSNKNLTFEMKDLFSKVANDIIATTALGLQSDSFKEPDNEVYTMGKDAANFVGFRAIIFFLHFIINPTILKWLNIRIFSKKVTEYFTSVISETVRIRKENGIIRLDMIHLLMEAQNGNLKNETQDVPDTGFAVVQESSPTKYKTRPKMEINDEDITAQALIFFAAGFSATSTLMAYVAYELALSPDVQEKLSHEVMDALQRSNGNITYEALLKMKYLDMVVTETLRKWPPSEVFDRHCLKTFKVDDGNCLEIDANLNVWIPVYAIQRDPKYYPNPDEFDPERFSNENKHNIKPYTYLPFGLGPRACIGSRFALLEVKLVTFEILAKFKIVPVAKTQIPIVLNKGDFGVVPEKGIWLELQPKIQTNSERM